MKRKFGHSKRASFYLWLSRFVLVPPYFQSKLYWAGVNLKQQTFTQDTKFHIERIKNLDS